MANSPSATGPSPPPGWYPDPQNPAGGARWWDGTQWLPNVGPAPSSVVLAPGGFDPNVPMLRGPVPASPATGIRSLYHRNPSTAVTLILCLIYVVIGATTKAVFLGIAPVFMTVRAFQRKEQYAAVAAVAAVLAVVLAVAHL